MSHSQKNQTNEEFAKLQVIKKILEGHTFITPRFLQNPFSQLFLSNLLPTKNGELPRIQRNYILLPDGAQLAADCIFQKKRDRHATIVILTGFEGYVQNEASGLAVSMGGKAYEVGYNVVHLRQRAEGDTIHLAKKTLAYIPEDLPVAFEQFQLWGLKKIYVIGYSAGGYNLLFALGILGKAAQSLINGAVAISAPIATFATWNHVEKSPFFNWHLLRGYKKLIERRAAFDPPGTWDLEKLKSIKTKHEWAEEYFPYWGYTQKFKSLEELNKKTDVSTVISNVQIPTLIIHAADDPVSPIESFLKPEFQNNPYLLLLLTKYGGHCSFLMLKKLYGDTDRYWSQNRALEFISLLNHENKELNLLGIDDSLKNRV